MRHSLFALNVKIFRLEKLLVILFFACAIAVF